MLDFLRQVILGGRGDEPRPEAEARVAQAEREGRRARRRRARAPERAAAGPSGSFGQAVRLTAEAPHRLEGGRTHALADTVFDVASDYPDDRIGIDVGDGAVIDVLRVRVRPGVTGIDRFIRLGSGVRIGLIDVEAAGQTDPTDEKQDGFLQIRVPDVRIDAVRFRNIDTCLRIREAARVWIGSFDCESYSKGVKIERSADIYIGALRATGASPYGVPRPGFNGVTISDSTRVHLPRVEIEDAAEHGIYLAGGGGKDYSQGIRFGAVTTRRTGQCGFKCKATVTPNVDVSVDTLTVFDAAANSRPGLNEDALRVENCHGFHIGALQVRRERRRYSCYAGLFLNGVTDFSLGGGIVEDTFGPMVMVEDSRGANARLLIAQLTGANIGAEGYRIRHANGNTLEELVVVGGRLEGVAGDAVSIEGGARMAAKPNYIRLDTAGLGGAAFRDAAGDPGNQVVVTDMGAVGPDRPVPRP